jgi:hypothetical protein
MSAGGGSGSDGGGKGGLSQRGTIDRSAPTGISGPAGGASAHGNYGGDSSGGFGANEMGGNTSSSGDAREKAISQGFGSTADTRAGIRTGDASTAEDVYGSGKTEEFSDSELEKGYTDDGQKINYYGDTPATLSKAVSLGLTQEVFDKEGNPTGKFEQGRNRIDPVTGQLARADLTFSEHWDNAPKAIRWSPTLRFLYASGKNLNEWAKTKGWNFNSNTGNFTDGRGGNVGERQLMNAAAPDAPGLVSGQSNTQTTSGSYSASQWYANLGNTNTTGSNPFSFSTAFADAKAKQQTILGNPSPIQYLAVNKSPFYNWLKENSLNKGIL